MEPIPPDAWEHAREPVLGGLRVLLVDDERESRALLTAFFSLEGIEAVATGDVREALAALDSGAFHLVIADLGLPGASGFDLLREIRRRPDPIGTIPILAVTGRATARDRDRVLEAGFQAHVAKPVDLQALLVTMRAAVARTIHPPAGAARGATHTGGNAGRVESS